MRYNEKELVDCIIGAAIQASEHSEEANLPLSEISDRNEQWVTSYVAIHLNDLLRKHGSASDVYVTSEARVSWLPSMCGVENPDEIEAALEQSELSSGRKFDLAAWNEEYVTGLVEIKNAPGMDSYRFEDDLQKLDAALSIVGHASGSSLNWGAYLFSVRLTKNQLALGMTVQELLDRRLNGLRAEFSSSISYESPRKVGTTDGWALGWGLVLLRTKPLEPC